MWIITVLFVAALFLAHASIGNSHALALHISQMRPLTIFAHLLFLLLIAAALCFARIARRSGHNLSAGLGVGIALSIFAAWLTPTVSQAHDFFASAPFIILFFYVPIMLFHGGHFSTACITLSVPPVCNLLLVLGYGGSSGQLQKLNALLFLALLNLLSYRVIPSTHPLFNPPFLEKPGSTDISAE